MQKRPVNKQKRHVYTIHPGSDSFVASPRALFCLYTGLFYTYTGLFCIQLVRIRDMNYACVRRDSLKRPVYKQTRPVNTQKRPLDSPWIWNTTIWDTTHACVRRDSFIHSSLEASNPDCWTTSTSKIPRPVLREVEMCAFALCDMHQTIKCFVCRTQNMIHTLK